MDFRDNCAHLRVFNHSYMAVQSYRTARVNHYSQAPRFPLFIFVLTGAFLVHVLLRERKISFAQTRFMLNTRMAQHYPAVTDGNALPALTRIPSPCQVVFLNIYVLPRCSYVRLPVSCLVGVQGGLASVDHQYCGAGNTSFDNWLNLI